MGVGVGVRIGGGIAIAGTRLVADGQRELRADTAAAAGSGGRYAHAHAHVHTYAYAYAYAPPEVTPPVTPPVTPSNSFPAPAQCVRDKGICDAFFSDEKAIGRLQLRSRPWLSQALVLVSQIIPRPIADTRTADRRSPSLTPAAVDLPEGRIGRLGGISRSWPGRPLVLPAARPPTWALSGHYPRPRYADDTLRSRSMPQSRSPSAPHEPDTSPTRLAERWGWWLYGFGAEGYSAVGQALFIPVVIERLAAQAGVQQADHTLACSRGADADSAAHSACVVPIAGLYIETSSLVLYTTTIATLVQLVLFLGLGGAADFGAHRKMLLMMFATACAIVTIGFLGLTQPQYYWVGCLLLIVSSACYGVTFVFHYAWIP
ncbi:hypothetical protein CAUPRSCDRAFT_11269, partial [Caulochytrium protostelioides]